MPGEVTTIEIEDVAGVPPQIKVCSLPAQVDDTPVILDVVKLKTNVQPLAFVNTIYAGVVLQPKQPDEGTVPLPLAVAVVTERAILLLLAS